MMSDVFNLTELSKVSVDYAEGKELSELLVLLFLRQVDLIVRRGLFRKYRLFEDELMMVRGKVDVNRTQMLHLRGRPRIHCSYEEFSIDCEENQVVFAALQEIANNRVLLNQSRSHAYRLSMEFEGVSGVRNVAETIRSIQYSRLNQHYAPLIRLSGIILQGTGIRHDFGEVDADGFLINMNRLFEVYVAKQLQKQMRQRGIRVRTQQKHRFDAAKKASIQPDLILEGKNRSRIVADTKYKIGSSPDRNDLYQMLSYCRILNIRHGVMITVGSNQSQTYEVTDRQTMIHVYPLDLDGSIDSIRESLAKLCEWAYRLSPNGLCS